MICSSSLTIKRWRVTIQIFLIWLLKWFVVGRTSRLRWNFLIGSYRGGVVIPHMNILSTDRDHLTHHPVFHHPEEEYQQQLCYLNHFLCHRRLAALDEGFAEGVLPVRPGVINLQCDMDHPTQSLADLAHLKHEFGSLENLRGKKIVMSWAYSPSYGKPLSVPQGVIALMSRFGMNIELAYPEGYDLIPEIVDIAKANAVASGGSLNIGHSMEEAMKDADIVYPKSWAPFHIMQQRTALLQKADKQGLKELEQVCLANNAKFKNWEYDAAKMKQTKNGDALYLHCLPADISGVSCEAGEVNAQVFERYRIKTYLEAGFKPYVIAAMMLTNRFENPAEILAKILNRNRLRSGI